MANPSVGDPRVNVLLVTESTYPYRFSGVSTSCQLLIEGLPEIDYHVLAIIGEPDSLPIFDLPTNVTALTTVPLWGTRKALESCQELSFGALRRAHRGGDEDAFVATLAPLVGLFVEALFAQQVDLVELARGIEELYAFFLTEDFDTSMRSEAVWNAFLAAADAPFRAAAERAGYTGASCGASDAVTGMHWLYHWLLPIARPLPAADLVHTTMAGACTLPAIAMKLNARAGFIHSEHGIYLREAYLRSAADEGSLFLKLMKIGFARRMTELSYAFADQILTCCDSNQRWAFQNGAARDRVTTVYYGLDPVAFAVPERTEPATPTVVWVGRIDPLKDLETLLEAASRVRSVRGDVRFRLYGSVAPGNEAYGDRILARRRELGLDEVVELAGYTPDPRVGYGEADIVVLSSVSEGFPYCTLEAMLCGKPVVATSVGGVDEQLGDCGVLVEPRNPERLASALLELLDDPHTARQLGASARERAKSLFSLETHNRRHREMYASASAAGLRTVPLAAVASTSESKRDPFTASEPAMSSLVERTRAAVPRPVDGLEIAAVLEASGVTDAIAHRCYGAHDVFELGADTLARLQAPGQAAKELRHHELLPPTRTLPWIPGTGCGLLMLLPAAVVLVLGHFLTTVPSWTSGAGRALLLGLTSSMVITNAFLLGIVHRSSLFIGCERWKAARTFLWRVSWRITGALLSLDAIGVFAVHALTRTPTIELLSFGLSFAGLAMFWILAGGLIVLGRTHEAGLATLAGIAAAIVSDQLVAGAAADRLEIAILVGYLVTVLVIAARILRVFPVDPGAADAYRPPPAAYVLDEGLPYFMYGGLLIVLVLGPNLLTSFVQISRTTSRLDLGSVQVGMTLALVPLMLSLRAADDALHAFWQEACHTLSVTSIEQIDEACGELFASQRVLRSRYLRRLGLISVVCIPVLWLLDRAGSFHDVGVGSASILIASFSVSLCAYFALARAQFDSMLPLSLARPSLALRALAAGVAAMSSIAAAIFLFHTDAVGPVSLLVGTVTFALVANSSARGFFRRLVFSYERAL